MKRTITTLMALALVSTLLFAGFAGSAAATNDDSNDNGGDAVASVDQNVEQTNLGIQAASQEQGDQTSFLTASSPQQQDQTINQEMTQQNNATQLGFAIADS